MKNRKIICIILMIFLTFFITKQAYAEIDAFIEILPDDIKRKIPKKRSARAHPHR